MDISQAIQNDDTLVVTTVGALRKLLGEMSKPQTRWQRSAAFAKKEGKTHRQMDTLRENNPTWFKWDKTRWLIDTKAYYENK